MKAGYSTNSFGDADPLDALSLLCEQGYASLAITPDRNILNPYEKTFALGGSCLAACLGEGPDELCC